MGENRETEWTIVSNSPEITEKGVEGWLLCLAS